MKAKTEKKYKPNKNLILQKMDSSFVGFDTDKSYLYTFNETAEFIFKKIKLGWDEEKIVLYLAKKYEVDLPTLRTDVKKIIKDMLKNKILFLS